MIESKLTDLLERAADHTTPGPPPIDAMYAGAGRRRRRRTVALCASAAFAVLAATGGTALLVNTRPAPEDAAPPIASTSPGVPTDLRLVGIGHVAVSVPKDWGTNQQHCFTPTMDTVLIDVGAVDLCLIDRPRGVESLYMAQGKPSQDFRSDETIEVDGVRAERQRTKCVPGGPGEADLCRGMVFLPSLDVSFRAESSTNADEVDRMLERISIVPDRVGVPPFQWMWSPRDGTSGERYAAALRKLGLVPKIRTIKSPGYTPGELLAISPAAGTMLPPGSTVTLTVGAR
ncbi:PASTA domain-containing protein [Kribbella sp. NPDC023972]|uniref:PASTA domain-containing protein n=1 Tax=Kribbella sp. NPDC023972 TaxID=3154795 RepID=UPI0033EB99EC